MQLQRGSFQPAFRNNRPRSLAPARNVAANAGVRKTIPIFPLNVVALPSATVPLMIFEARYRVLFNTLLSGDPNVEEGLVQKESPFCGTREFGMCYVDKDGRVAAIGTVLNIKEALFMKEDGRLLVTSKGRDRFEIKNIVKQKPVLVAEVELIEEDQSEPTSEAIELAREVSDLLRSTIKLNVKMNNVQASEDQLEPEELADLGPRDVSFFVASFFSDFKLLQQNLLEETSTISRLQREKDILNETLKYYSAASALKSAFNSSDTETTP